MVAEFRFSVNVQIFYLQTDELPSLWFQINAINEMTEISILKLKIIVFNVESEERRHPCRSAHVTPLYIEKRDHF